MDKYIETVKNWYVGLTTWKKTALWIGVAVLLFGMAKGVFG